MPRLAKGGKWVYSWVVISAEGKMPIPPEAWQEYGLQAGSQVVFLRGSRRSGGFSISTPERIADAFGQLEMGARVLGQTRLERDGSVTLPPAIEAEPGDRLLAVRGSRLALGLVARGPIYEEATKHPGLAESVSFICVCLEQGGRVPGLPEAGVHVDALVQPEKGDDSASRGSS